MEILVIFYYLGILCFVAPLIAGIVLRFFPPKYGNELYGYSTKASRYNKETWAYAHKISGNIMLIFSTVTIPLYTVLLIFFHDFFYNKHPYLIGIFGFVSVIICIILTIIITQTKTNDLYYMLYRKELGDKGEKEQN